MSNEIIYRGIRIKSDKCRYFKVSVGNVPKIYEDTTTSTLNLIYSPGSSAESLSKSLGLDLIGSGNINMTPTNHPIKFKKTYITLNGLKLEKLTYDPHIINIIIVRDSESRVVQNYNYTTFIISKEDSSNPEFIKYLFYSGQLLYLKPVGPQVVGYNIKNYPKLIIGDKDLNINSDNDTIYSLRKRYDDYLIREIDYQDQFILELRRILDNYGVELVRLNKEQTLTSTSYITYQFNQTPLKFTHPFRSDLERNILSHKQPVEFTLHTTDMVLYHDFKSRYSNVFLLTNFTEFKTTDKAGDRWSTSVKWGSITEDFNHLYQPDDNSNFSLQCQFRCELYYYEVIDTRFEFLNDIMTRLNAEDA